MALTPQELTSILHQGVERAHELNMIVESAVDGTCKLRLPANEKSLRPGGTIAGPTMMGLADAAMWISVMSAKGALQLAVTTSFNINFLRKPALGDLLAEGRILKLGSQLVVLEVTLYSEEMDAEPVAHATGTYSLPSRHK